MPLPMSDIDTLQRYIEAVIRKSDHHAKGVDLAALSLVGMIVWRKDPGRFIEVMRHKGNMANVLWVYMGGKRYAISYAHELGVIQVREKTIKGDSLINIDNDTPLDEIKRFFAKLNPPKKKRAVATA